MEKLTVQDFGMFIDQEIELYYPSPQWIKETNPRYILKGVNHKTKEVLLESKKTGVGIWYSIEKQEEYWEYMKLILRPLSDMTEEEMEELYPEGNYNDYLEEGAGFISPDMTYFTRDEWLAYYQMPYPSIPKALKLGFDLFGYIPAGLAIDRNSIK